MLTVLSIRFPRGSSVNTILTRCRKPVARTRRGHISMSINKGEKKGRLENTHGSVEVEGWRNNNFVVGWKAEIDRCQNNFMSSIDFDNIEERNCK
jgi:hypothetical protein